MMHEKFLCYEVTLGSLGHEEMLWPQPVRPGDTIIGSITIKSIKISKSKRGLGFLPYEALLKNPNRKCVFSTMSALIINPRQGVIKGWIYNNLLRNALNVSKP